MTGTGAGRATSVVFAEPGLSATIVPLDKPDPNRLAIDLTVAADARAGQHRHAREDAEIEPTVPRRRGRLIEDPRIGGLARKRVDVPAPAALEDQCLQALLAQLLRGPAAADARADDCDVNDRQVVAAWRSSAASIPSRAARPMRAMAPPTNGPASRRRPTSRMSAE